MHSDVEVILFGQGDGYEEAAAELGMVHRPDVLTNEKGVPRVDSMFTLAAQDGRHPLHAYVNCDIILLSDFLAVATRIGFDRFLMVAQRWNLDVPGAIDFTNQDWGKELKGQCQTYGNLAYPGAIDIFLARGPVWQALPPMVVGRGMYDQWLIYYCRARKVPVVDVTAVTTLIHQNHDYTHIEGGHRAVEVGAEATRNLQLGGGYRYMFTIQDADWRMSLRGLERNWCRGDSVRYGEVFGILHETMPTILRAVCRVGAEVMCELNARCSAACGGEWMPLVKVPGWLVKRIAKIFSSKG